MVLQEIAATYVRLLKNVKSLTMESDAEAFMIQKAALIANSVQKNKKRGIG